MTSPLSPIDTFTTLNIYAQCRKEGTTFWVDDAKKCATKMLPFFKLLAVDAPSSELDDFTRCLERQVSLGKREKCYDEFTALLLNHC
jgi:hypothetical protein